MELTPVKAFAVRDDVLYVITDEGEDHAFLLARTSPVAVSSVLLARQPDDVHRSAQAMLHAAVKAEQVDGVLTQHLTVDHRQDAFEIATLNNDGLVLRHRELH